VLEDNIELLRYSGDGVSVIGMGEVGMYSRIAAPFFGSELTFVSPDAVTVAAPGQLALDRALDIYGDDRSARTARHLFAVTGDPVSHSLSPSIHNPQFRALGVPAAYTIAQATEFSEAASLLDRGIVTGLSVTAPFKEDVLQWASQREFTIGENARLCGAANTIVAGRLRVVDNTDVDGFAAILASSNAAGRRVAVVGAGGTARAAVVAALQTGAIPVVFNRGLVRAAALASRFRIDHYPLYRLGTEMFDVILDTTSSGEFNAKFSATSTYVRAAYGEASAVEARARRAGATVIDGLSLLRAQAVRQNQLFVQAIHDQ
jgi:shikimate 5-dehydrogenase